VSNTRDRDSHRTLLPQAAWYVTFLATFADVPNVHFALRAVRPHIHPGFGPVVPNEHPFDVVYQRLPFVVRNADVQPAFVQEAALYSVPVPSVVPFGKVASVCHSPSEWLAVPLMKVDDASGEALRVLVARTASPSDAHVEFRGHLTCLISIKAGRGSGFAIRRILLLWALMSRRRGVAQEFVTAAGKGKPARQPGGVWDHVFFSAEKPTCQKYMSMSFMTGYRTPSAAIRRPACLNSVALSR